MSIPAWVSIITKTPHDKFGHPYWRCRCGEEGGWPSLVTIIYMNCRCLLMGQHWHSHRLFITFLPIYLLVFCLSSFVHFLLLFVPLSLSVSFPSFRGLSLKFPAIVLTSSSLTSVHSSTTCNVSHGLVFFHPFPLFFISPLSS